MIIKVDAMVLSGRRTLRYAMLKVRNISKTGIQITYYRSMIVNILMFNHIMNSLVSTPPTTTTTVTTTSKLFCLFAP